MNECVGIIPLSLPRERVDLAGQFHRGVLASLENAGLTVLSPVKPVFQTSSSIELALNYQQQGAVALIFLLGTWINAPTVVDTVRAVNLPTAVWAEDNPASFSLTAGGIVHGSLDELGLAHRFFYGPAESESLSKEVTAFIKGAGCRKALSGERLCVVGGRVHGMYTTMADIIQVKKTFGVEIEHLDSLRIYLEALEVSPEEVKEVKEDLLPQLGRINIQDEVLERSLRLYLALKGVLSAGGYKLAAVKCMDEMINNYASFCLANSLLNDEGFTISCEGDIYAAITMKILQAASGETALFGDVNHLDMEKRILRIVNCGSMPFLLAESRGEVDLENQYDYLCKAGGATTVFSVKDAPVTAARLFRIEGEYGLLAFQGRTVKESRERFREAREYWPQAFVSFDCSPDGIIQNLRSNHLHLSPGSCLDVLKEFCRLLKIRTFLPDLPAAHD